MNESATQGRVGMTTIVGRPNVGKSTFLNQVLGEKISIVSSRPQTTRNRILGIKTHGADQLVLLDTPGIHKHKGQLNRFMIEEAMESTQGVDCLVLMTEIAKSTDSLPESQAESFNLHPLDLYVLEQLRGQKLSLPMILAINKLDLVSKRHFLLPMIAAWRDQGFEAIVPISARTGEGIPQLEQEILQRFPLGPLLFPPDMITDQVERSIAAELIREQVFHRCRQEVPYSVAVEIVRFEERPRKEDVSLEAVIHVERDSQKAILVGKGGATIKELGMGARQEIAKFLGCPVHLKLTVHVEPNWSRLPESRRKLGYR